MLVPDGGTPHDRIPLVRRGHHRPREPDLPLRQACVLHRRSPGCPSRHEGSAEPARAAQAGGSPAGAQRLGGEVRSSIVALAAAVARKAGAERGYTAPVLLAESGDTTGRMYGVWGPPTVYLLDRQGRLVGRAAGPRAWESPAARALIEALLSAPR